MSKVPHDGHQGATNSHRLSAEGCELKTMPWDNTAQEPNTSVVKEKSEVKRCKCGKGRKPGTPGRRVKKRLTRFLYCWEYIFRSRLKEKTLKWKIQETQTNIDMTNKQKNKIKYAVSCRLDSQLYSCSQEVEFSSNREIKQTFKVQPVLTSLKCCLITW